MIITFYFSHILKMVIKMIVRLGYVAISKALDNVTSSSTITYTNYEKLDNKSEKLDSVIKSNFEDLIKILNYNVKNNVHFYRLTSKLIPLATHKEVNFDYIKPYKGYYKKVSNIINNNNIRVDVHPDQFCVLNSTNKDIVQNSIDILEYHINILNALKIKNPIIILHVGSNTFGKENSIKRFINNFSKLSPSIKNSIAIENDDKVFNVEDVLKICDELKVPMVLDYHHHICNPIDNIDDYFELIFNTWNNIRPKIHFSSPKNKTKRDFRSHNDYINSDDFICFIEKIKKYSIDVDIMLEAKAKDDALFRLVRELKYKTDYKFIDDTSFLV